MWNAGLNEAQAGIKIAGRNINNLRYADDTTLMAESEEELKSLLVKVKQESEKVGLKLNIQKTKILTSGPITSWQIDGETMETETDFIFLGSKITAHGDCSQPGSWIHGILQARILEWVAMPSSGGGVFPTQRSNLLLLCLLHWQVGSLPLAQPGKPRI